ncbi:MAG TPA: S8 family serine peptidase [Thermoanaerobaculia bacterium]|nr:S8 family serine peptidase [Thermoanaerobaculia bacterium]
MLLAPGSAAKPGATNGTALPVVGELANRLTATHGGNVKEVWEHALQGFLVHMTEAQARLLANDPRVAAVEQNFSVPPPLSTAAAGCNTPPFAINARPLPSPSATPQSLICNDPDPNHDTAPGAPICQDNWGLDRIDQVNPNLDHFYSYPLVPGTSSGVNGTGVNVYLIEAGVNAANREFQDFNGNSRVFGVDVTTNPPASVATLTDCLTNGHGTHVAGIIGGRTFGVAKGVQLNVVSLCHNGTPVFTLDTFIRGLNWIASHFIVPAVVNWSGANEADLVNALSLQQAVTGVLQKGIPIVQAAGNQSNNPKIPAQSGILDSCDWTFKQVTGPPQVIVAGGMDEYDGRWVVRPGDVEIAQCPQTGAGTAPGDCGSNAGACIDIWAPAAHILSAGFSATNSYCRLTGTSMAAPHVTGAIALYLELHPFATIDEVRNFLRSQGTWNVFPTLDNASAYGIGNADNVLLNVRNLSVGSDLPPTATFTVSCNGQTCTFDATGSTQTPGTSYAWDFGDGTGTLFLFNPGPHTFPVNFNGRVNLQVHSGSGKTAHFSRRVTLGNSAPVASFVFFCSQLQCSFDARSSVPSPVTNNSIIAYDWCFGEGTCINGPQLPDHTYATPSAQGYIVTLKITDTSTAQSTVQKRVVVTSSPPGPALTFFPLNPPCRLLDTRLPAPPTNGAPLTNGQPLILQVTGTTCNLPAGTQAVAVNTTAVGPTSSGWLTFYPGNVAANQSTSLVNFSPAQGPVANDSILALDGNGRLGINPGVAGSPGQVHLILDVSGYFTTAFNGIQYQPVVPCRLGDQTVAPGATTAFNVVTSPCSVPASAQAISAVLTDVPPPSSWGHLTAYRSNIPLPGVSNLNFNPGVMLSNGAIVNLALAPPEINVIYVAGSGSAAINVRLDVNGYFANTTPDGLKFHAVTPCRLVDTRFAGWGAPSLAGGASRFFQVQGNCGVPYLSNVEAAMLNVIVVNPTASGSLTAYSAAASRPAIPNFVFSSGGIIDNGSIVPLVRNASPGTNDLALFLSNGQADVIVEVYGYFSQN